MGGRGASSGGIAGGTGGGKITQVMTQSLISAREGNQAEVDQVLQAMRMVEDMYGVVVTDAQVATLGIQDAGVMAYYDINGNLAISSRYFDSATMNKAYDDCVNSGFHPSRGNKSGLEATAAHELGHRLTDVAGVNAGYGTWAVDKTAGEIVRKAANKIGYKSAAEMCAKISGYAKQNSAEAVAEAFADVYCNGLKAKKESIAVKNELDRYFKGVL